MRCRVKGGGAVLILGIDPGFAIVGFGLVEAAGGRQRLVTCGAITTPAGDPLPARLRQIADDMDLLLVNDFIGSSAFLAAEEVGYLPKGEGWKYVLDGRIAYDGDKPMNTNGGRTSYGHAFAASGMADVFEAVTQMRGEAGERQVKKLPKHTFLRGFGGAQNVRAIILESKF